MSEKTKPSGKSVTSTQIKKRVQDWTRERDKHRARGRDDIATGMEIAFRKLIGEHEES